MRLPPSMPQEDATRLMYYDNVLMRAEAEPVQRRLLNLVSYREDRSCTNPISNAPTR